MVTKLKKIIVDNWEVKLLAFILALVLWYVVKGKEEPVAQIAEKTFSIPVEIQIQDNLKNISTLPAIELKISGKKEIIDQLSDKDFVIIIDAKDIEGKYNAQISEKNIYSPFSSSIDKDIKITEINPKIIALNLKKF